MHSKIDKNNYDGIIVIIILIGVLILWFTSWYFIDTCVVSQNQQISDTESRGLFGDKFGAINSLFSGLAFAGIIFTIFLQRKELSLQRQELKETRDVFINQGKTLDLQRFENTFFNLLQLHKDVYNNIRINSSNKEIIGGFVLSHLWNQFYGQMTKSGINSSKDVASEFTIFVNKNENIIGPYFATVFYIFQFLDSLEIENKSAYIKLIRAHLTMTEKLFLFYQGQNGGINNKLKPLIEKFHLLHLLDTNKLIIPEDWDYYAISAYND